MVSYFFNFWVVLWSLCFLSAYSICSALSVSHKIHVKCLRASYIVGLKKKIKWKKLFFLELFQPFLKMKLNGWMLSLFELLPDKLGFLHIFLILNISVIIFIHDFYSPYFRLLTKTHYIFRCLIFLINLWLTEF